MSIPLRPRSPKTNNKAYERAKSDSSEEDSVRWSDRTFTHAGGLQGVATVAVAVELGPVQLEHPALRLVVQSH